MKILVMVFKLICWAQENKRIKLIMKREEHVYNCIKIFFEDKTLNPNLGAYFLQNPADDEDERLSEEALVKDLKANEVFLDVETENMPMTIDKVDDIDWLVLVV